MDILERKIKAFIVEDVKDNRDVLIRMLSKYEDNIEIIGYADNIDEAHEFLTSHVIDLVFLDIQLDKGTSFDLLDKLHDENKVKFEIVFVTGHGNFETVTRAISFSALDFITKPIEPENLDKAIEKALKRIDFRQYNRQIDLLLEYIQKPSVAENRIAFQTVKGGVEFVQLEEINYLEADGVITYVFKTDQTRIPANKNLGYYSRLLSHHHYFFQISSSILVNTRQVKKYYHSDLKLDMINGTTIYASRRGGQDFKRHLAENQEFNFVDKESIAKSLLNRIFGKS